MIFSAELDMIARSRGARVQCLAGDRVGRFTPALLRYFAPDLADRDVFLCGSPRFAGEVRGALREAGLPEAQLHEERFDF